jgi:hypothetical protein
MKSKKGGRRPGAGRPKGSPNKRTKEQREKMLEVARQTGLLPHEILLAVAQGRSNAVFGRLTREARLDLVDAAAKAAPYYAPRLAAVVMKMTDKSNPWEEILSMIENKPRVGLPRSARARLRVIDGTGTRVSAETPGARRTASR